MLIVGVSVQVGGVPAVGAVVGGGVMLVISVFGVDDIAKA
jgi:hypothetical protein